MKPVALAGGLLIVGGVVIGNLPATRHDMPLTTPQPAVNDEPSAAIVRLR
jgi:hypothetical protein